jgi:serine/threonine-protein kinase RsbW
MHWYGKTKYFTGPVEDLGLGEKVQQAQVRLPSELGELSARLEDWMRFLGYPRRDIFAVQLVLHEAASNAYRHGNRGDPDKSIRVSYLVAPDEVLVVVEDQGPGFDPGLVLDPLAGPIRDRPAGFGLLLMRAYSTWVQFDPPGNRVTFCRRRSDSQVPGPPGLSGPAAERGPRDPELQ